MTHQTHRSHHTQQIQHAQQGQQMSQQNRDQVVAQDLLMGAKASVRSCAMALTESATPEVRSALKRQLDDAVTFHDQVTQYMIDRGLYSPHNMQQQIQHDIQTAQQITGGMHTR